MTIDNQFTRQYNPEDSSELSYNVGFPSPFLNHTFFPFGNLSGYD
jgi:hypothetical protein